MIKPLNYLSNICWHSTLKIFYYILSYIIQYNYYRIQCLNNSFSTFTFVKNCHYYQTLSLSCYLLPSEAVWINPGSLPPLEEVPCYESSPKVSESLKILWNLNSETALRKSWKVLEIYETRRNCRKLSINMERADVKLWQITENLWDLSSLVGDLDKGWYFRSGSF